MNINPKIFKAYDIRGIYPGELNKQAAFLIGLTFAHKSKAKQTVIGRDMRLSGTVLKKALIQGLNAGGIKQIIDIGLVPIDAVYYCVGILKYESGIMVTASHNPAEYNGFKMVMKNMKCLRGRDIQKAVLKFNKQKILFKNKKVKINKKNIYPKYIKHILSFTKLKKIKPLKIVVDAGNGMAGKVMPMLKKYLSIKIVPMNFKLDGNFPAHPSNPLEPKSQLGISKKVKKEKANLGIIFDGDADRLFFIDEKGKFIRADITLLLLAKFFLDKTPGAGIVHNVICSKMVGEQIRLWGGRPIRSPVGYVNVSSYMRKFNGVMGGELSAHYSFKQNAYADSGFIALVTMLELLSELNKPLSKIVKPFYKYYKLPEINMPVKNINKKLREIKEKYKEYKQDYLDGVTVDNWRKNGWWFNVRPSNTEPLLRLTIEAKNKKKLNKLKKELVALIKK